MDNVVTWSVFAWVIGGIVAFSAACWAFAYFSTNLLHSRVSSMGRRHDDYREQVAKEYVRHEHLQAAETRLSSSVDGLRSDVKEQTRTIDKMAAALNRMIGRADRLDEEPE